MAGPDPHIRILMGTYNGAEFLEEQLASLLAQSHRNWTLTVSDDGSADSTHQIVQAFGETHPERQVTLVDGPRTGFAMNFLSLIHGAPSDDAYIALCDQDDVWKPDHLARAVTLIGQHPSDLPVLRGGRTAITDAALTQTGLSPLFRRPPGFANALVQSIAGGNTMIMNAAAAALARKAGVVDIVSHDWWLYLLVTGAGGVMIYDDQPTILYRQHGGNKVGSNRRLSAQITRARLAFSGRYAGWNRRNIAALEPMRDDLTEANRALLDEFIRLRSRRGPGPALRLMKHDIRRQSLLGTSLLLGAAMLGRI